MKRRIIATLFCCVLFFNSLNCLCAESEAEKKNATPAMDMSLQDSAKAGGQETESVIPGLEEMHSNSYTPEEVEQADIKNPENPGKQEKVIVGSDDRTQIYNSWDYPFSAIAFMVAYGQCGCTWTGSGFMVGERGLATAAHCLVCETHHMPVDYIDFYFGYQPDGSYMYFYNGPFLFWWGTDFRNGYQNDMEWDYGYVKFDEPIGQYVGYFGVRALSDQDFQQNSYYNLAAYRDGVMMTDFDKVTIMGPNIIIHDIDAVPGYSGGPIFGIDGSDDYCVAIHIAENSQYNSARRINMQLFNEMAANGVIVPDY